MDDANEAIKTVMKMSPPMLLIVGINVIIFVVERFITERFITAIAVGLGAFLTPLLIPNGVIDYDVPSPMTARIIFGMIFGFLAVAVHDKFKRLLQKWGYLPSTTDCPPSYRPPHDYNVLMVGLVVIIGLAIAALSGS